ncbi:MAG: M6 family metalloprotease domain-containing protein, partial [Candidatus Delongbacteria bacterium]|nr:M6 family metalloprotease domain-containing protein [Candidatus Delongbacteria bacterium]
LLILMTAMQIFAAYISNIPMTIIQPDGTEMNCLASGDEFFNRLHDENDYSIIQGDDGWYYYGVKSNGNVIPSEYIAGDVDPESVGLEKRAVISEELYKKKVESFNNYTKTKDAPTIGTIENVVIFIRFSDETESEGFGYPRSYYDTFFNKVDGPSLNHYFEEVSYNKLTVNSYYYPETTDFTYNLSYQDTYARAYFQPYNASTNPIGYDGDTERTEREHALLERAVLAVGSEVPPELEIDGDGDGYVDNVVFLISGMPGAWASLLWPHRWSLYTITVNINGKRVYDYNFDLTGNTSYFHTGVICHEFFHTLGAPDLYHYYDATAPDAVGPWDIMNQTSDPPQYMGAYMKYKYGDWIDTLPIISDHIEYTLNPLTQQDNNIFRINSPISALEYFVVEYRKQDGIYESNLPGIDDGLLIYRINTDVGNGNASGPPDEVYIYRPDGTLTAQGSLSDALYSSGLGRTSFNNNTNPVPFLSDDALGDINIYNIGVAGETITFSLGLSANLPTNLIASTGNGQIELNWIPPERITGVTLDHYILYKDDIELTTTTDTTYSDVDVVVGNTYEYSVSAFFTGDITGESARTDVFTINYNSPKSLPYQTDCVDLEGWSQFMDNCTPRWELKNSSTAGGTAPELFATYENTDPATSRFVTPALFTTGIDTLEIKFKHYYDAFEPGLTIGLEMSSNMFDWIDTGFKHTVGTSDIGPEEVILHLTTFPDPVYFSWTLDGNLYNVDGWYVDDIYVANTTTGIEDESIPYQTKLVGNYPNPFNPDTNISFTIGEDSNVKINIFNENGALVNTIVSSYIKKGVHSVNWNASEYSTGIYFIIMEVGNYRESIKTLLIK